MYSQMTKFQKNSILSSLRNASEDFYLHDGTLCELLATLEAAIFLQNKEGLAVFKDSIRESVKQLQESNKSMTE